MIEKAYILYIDTEESRQYAADCGKSCEKYKVPHEMYRGFRNLTIEEMAKMTGWKIGREKLEDHDKQYWREYNAALGHIEMWKKIAAGDKPRAILEHDAIVKRDFTDVEVEDMEIVFLGPRVEDRDDYEWPEGHAIDKIKVRRFEGLHAYALTPKTAQFLLDKISEERRLLPSEALISVRNRYDLNLYAMDPPYAVCELGRNRRSFTMESEKTGRINFRHFPGFIAGTKPGATPMEENDYIFTDDWFSANIENWKQLFEATNKNATDELKILEIGSYEGRATTWLIDNMLENKNSMLFAVDTFQGSPEHTSDQKNALLDKYSRNLSVSKYPERVKTIQGPSQVVLPAIESSGNKFDIIYVDGSHETLDVLTDALNSLRLLKEDGIMIFDDYQWHAPDGSMPVMKAIDIFHRIAPVELLANGYQRAYRRSEP